MSYTHLFIEKENTPKKNPLLLSRFMEKTYSIKINQAHAVHAKRMKTMHIMGNNKLLGAEETEIGKQHQVSRVEAR